MIFRVELQIRSIGRNSGHDVRQSGYVGECPDIFAPQPPLDVRVDYSLSRNTSAIYSLLQSRLLPGLYFLH